MPTQNIVTITFNARKYLPKLCKERQLIKGAINKEEEINCSMKEHEPNCFDKHMLHMIKL